MKKDLEIHSGGFMGDAQFQQEEKLAEGAHKHIPADHEAFARFLAQADAQGRRAITTALARTRRPLGLKPSVDPEDQIPTVYPQPDEPEISPLARAAGEGRWRLLRMLRGL